MLKGSSSACCVFKFKEKRIDYLLEGMLVQKATGDRYEGQKLPTAHTFFNTVMLPACANKQLMEQQLLKPIQYSGGFELK